MSSPTGQTSSQESHETICSFCAEVTGVGEPNLFYDLRLATDRSDYLLAESDHHVVMPCVGALTDWYILIVSRRHALSTGWLDDTERRDLRTVLGQTTDWLRGVSGAANILVFEHGSLNFRDKGGSCYDHAHVHVVATDGTLEGFLQHIPPQIQLQECPDWIETAHEVIAQGRTSYLAVQDAETHLIGPATGAPSQFFRRCLASWLGAEDGEWDWLVYPQTDRVQKMIGASTALVLGAPHDGLAAQLRLPTVRPTTGSGAPDR